MGRRWGRLRRPLQHLAALLLPSMGAQCIPVDKLENRTAFSASANVLLAFGCNPGPKNAPAPRSPLAGGRRFGGSLPRQGDNDALLSFTPPQARAESPSSTASRQSLPERVFLCTPGAEFRARPPGSSWPWSPDSDKPRGTPAGVCVSG